MVGRTPHGVRGLKCVRKIHDYFTSWSHSARSAWIEIWRYYLSFGEVLVALRTECVDWNLVILRTVFGAVCRTPHGVRGLKCSACKQGIGAALSHSARSAWIEIGWSFSTLYLYVKSHSARSAWIEIIVLLIIPAALLVALRTECVDWNLMWKLKKAKKAKSHSARSAWIEINKKSEFLTRCNVALRTECVDWNGLIWAMSLYVRCRTPHGVRGLKSCTAEG